LGSENEEYACFPEENALSDSGMSPSLRC